MIQEIFQFAAGIALLALAIYYSDKGSAAEERE